MRPLPAIAKPGKRYPHHKLGAFGEASMLHIIRDDAPACGRDGDAFGPVSRVQYAQPVCYDCRCVVEASTESDILTE